MPAEIEKRGGVAQMFYAAESGPPWHGLGTPVDGALTSKEAIKKAGQDWEVDLVPVFAGKTRRRVPGQLAISRTLDGKVFGFCSKRYVPLQNREAFTFLDSLAKDSVIRYETAGCLFDGQRVWMLARLEQDMRVNGEEYFPYMLLVTDHTAAGAVRVLPTVIRAVCNNTVEMALASGGGFRAIHNLQLHAKLTAAQEVLQITTESTRRLAKWLEKAAKVKVTERVLAPVMEAVFGSLDEEPKGQRAKAVETFSAIYAAEQELNGPTAYSLIQAVTGYVDHARRYQGSGEERAERRFYALTENWGSGSQLKEKAIRALGTAVPSLK
jgi:phage/plasmid-like protein (TIGR03299 family)